MEKDSLVKANILCAVVCLIFLIVSVVFVLIMMQRNEQQGQQYLSSVAEQNTTAVYKQIQGDFQTLDGVATCLENGITAMDGGITETLKQINDSNEFVRMGLADSQGSIDWLDMDGKTYHEDNLTAQPFFQKVINGEHAISTTLWNNELGVYVHYYGVPLRKEGKTVGALCAVNTSSTMRKILETPVLGGSGHSHIVNSAGDIIVRSSALNNKDITRIQELGDFSPAEWERVQRELGAGHSVNFTYKSGAESFLAVLRPIGVDNWQVLSVVPRGALQIQYNATAFGTIAIVAFACLIFLLLLKRQGKMASQNRATLLHLAYDDELIGCRNLAKLLLDAEPLLADGKQTYAFWYADLKKFKYFNDVFGYDMGDWILRRLAALIEQTMPERALYGRVSADNFAGILPYKEKDELVAWFEEMVRRLEEEESAWACRLHVELCMGFYLPDGTEPDLSLNDMVNRANMAQKSVKMLGGGRYAFYTAEIREQTLRESNMESMARQALDKGEFVVYMQPKVDIQSGERLAGAEALARWEHPECGLISPGVFIPIFEHNGMIVRLDRNMLKQVCRWLRDYLADGQPPLNVAVNVSRLGLMQEDFVEYYAAVKEAHGIPDGLLELEFTESVVLDDDEIFLDTVRRMQKRGFICSLDDFGAGYSSLNLLKRLPIDVLKLDILFFRKGSDIRRERIVVSNIVSMARELQIKTIAEGVEDTEQVEFLRRAGCDAVQGYVFSKPMPLGQFDEMLRRRGNEAAGASVC